MPAAESRAARPSDPPALTPLAGAPTTAEAAALARIDALLRPYPVPTETTAPPIREPGTQVSIGKVRVEIIAEVPTPPPSAAPRGGVRRARAGSSLGPMSPKLRFGLGQL
ncbi:MAG TPA: hypothetical protein VFG83_15030 [Kofleriaceae bacterium]|nr:hypothetical protein [Kofleriaceae bacterium]